MAIKPGKRDVTKITKLLESEEYESADDLAMAVLNEAFAIYESKGKFTVAGQLFYDSGYVSPEDERASKVSLGLYSTEKQAEDAARALFYNSQTHEQFKSWVLPVHHGTPASYYSARKEAREEARRNDTRRCMCGDDMKAHDYSGDGACIRQGCGCTGFTEEFK